MAIGRTGEMTGRKNKSSPVDSLLHKSRRSERLRNKWQRYQPQQIIGARTGVRRHKRPFAGFPKLSDRVCDDFETLLRTAGLRTFYSCLDWNCPANNHVKHFLLNSTILKKKEGMEITYQPLECLPPLVITMEKFARALHLSLEGIFQVWDTAAIQDVKTETRYKLDSNERYFSVASAESRTMFIAGKFVNQGLFLQQNTSTLSLQQMILFRAALNGTPVAWGRVLWKNLVRRIVTIGTLASTGPGKKIELTHKLTRISYAAVVVALLLRVAHGPEHEAWFRSLPTLLPKGSYSESGESDNDFLIDVVDKRRRKTAKTLKEPRRSCSDSATDASDREFMDDLVANNRRKKAKIIKEETDAEENPLGFAIYNSTLLAEDVGPDEQMVTSTEDLAEGADCLHAGSEDMRACSPQRRENVHRPTTDLDISGKDEEDVPMIEEESETHVAVPDENQTERECASKYHIQVFGICSHNHANSSDLTTGRGNSAESSKTRPNDSWPGMEQQPVDNVHQLSSGNDSSNAAYIPDRFDVQMERLDVNVEPAVWKDDEVPEATEEHTSCKSKLKAVTAEPEGGACAVDVIEDVLRTRQEDIRNLQLEIVIDANQMSTVVPNALANKVELKNAMPEFVESGASVEAPPGLVSEIVKVPASTLVKMVHIVKHFLHGLDETGVPENVNLKLRAEKFMDALKSELEKRGLQEFIEQKELFGVDWSMDKIFDAQWSLQDRLRKSEKECLKLKEKVDEIFTSRFSLNKPFVSLVATNSAPGLGKSMDSSSHDQDVQSDRALPLDEALKSLKGKMKDVKDHVRTMEVVQERQRREWLKQRNVLVQRWNEVKFEYYKNLSQMQALEGKVMTREDTLRECEEKLQTESMRRSCSEVTIASLTDEVLHLKELLTGKADEIRHTQQERDEGVQAAKRLKEQIAMTVEELHMKDMDLINALTHINDLKQTVESMSDQIKVQNGTLSDRTKEIKYLQEEFAAWNGESSACKIERAALSKEKRRVELQRLNQICIVQKMEERIIELKGKLEISKDRIEKSDQLLEIKDEEIHLLKVEADIAEKKLQECKKRKDMALEFVQKQRIMQDACKRQVVSLQEERGKFDNQLDKVLKRESRLLKELEKEKERLEEGIFDQEQQDIWSIEEITENQTAADMRGELALLRAEKKDFVLSAFRRLRKIINSYKMDTGSYGQRSSASSAG